jgi:hypothetical protein
MCNINYVGQELSQDGCITLACNYLDFNKSLSYELVGTTSKADLV